jgi:hypothetical protein
MSLMSIKSSDRSRSKLFGFLLSCLFSDDEENKCPFALLRNTLTIEEKFDYVMNLNEKEINHYLNLHDLCLERRINL